MTFTTPRIQFIVPKEATNLFPNPSFETATTGYTASGAGVSIARVTTQSRRGTASCEITTATGVISGLYYAIALTSGTSYSFSADILDVAAQTFNLFITDASDTLKSTNVTWTGTGHWRRRSVTWTADASATFRMYVTRSAVASTTKFYVDGWQLETGAVSTYLDGNMRGFVVGETAYRWNGTIHVSTSWRSGQTRSGGTYVNLSTYAKLMTIVGLGMAPVSNIAVPTTTGGSYYQNTVSTERPFSLLINVNGTDYATIQANRKALAACLTANGVTRKQPLLIQYDELDANGVEIAETLEIPCLYESGFEGFTSPRSEQVALNFRMFVPMIYQQGEHGTALGYQTTVTDADAILMRTSAGVWQAMGTGMTGASMVVYTIAVGPDNAVYAGGLFTDAGGVANTSRIAKWDGSAWSALGTGAADQTVFAIVVAANGSLYAGGNFTLMGGVADTVRIAKWDGSVWTPLGTGSNNLVRALAIGPDGSLYAGGDFTLMGGVANTVRIAKWDGANWTALGTGAADGAVHALAISPDGSLYAAGSFTGMGGVANTNRIARWNGTAWVSVGGGMGTGTYIYSLAFDAAGNLYAGGTFTVIGGVTVSNIAKWDGAIWIPLGAGANNSVLSLHALDGLIYVGGIFTTVGGITPPDSMAIWNGSTWLPMDVNLPSTATAYSIISDSGNNFYIGFDTTGSAVSATVTASTAGSEKAYARIKFTGPGSIAQIKNYTTGKSIFFNLTLQAGEWAVLHLDPQNISFWSSFRGNILSTILPGSDMTFELLPGANNISAYYYTGTTASSAIEMVWRDRYDGIDGAVR